MPGEAWLSYAMKINGFEQNVRYQKKTIEMLFLPFLRKMNVLQKEKNKRLIVFLAAPPAVGKSATALFLEMLSKKTAGLMPVQAIGIDGFHLHAKELRRRTVWREGKQIPMADVKGCPETFATGKLKQKLQFLLTKADVYWPVYDRTIHDVIEDAAIVHEKIILLEGNWLLLRDPAWQVLQQYADYTIFIRAAADSLKERLIQRKIRGGKSRSEAAAFYEKSDRYNIMRALEDSCEPDEMWELCADGDYQKCL